MISRASGTTASPTEFSLSQMLREALDRRGMSNLALAKAAGVSEGTIRNLLRDEIDPDATGPKAHVLKQIAEVLELDDLRVFQAAGYIRQDRLASHLSVRAEYVATRFDQLPPDKQELLLGMLTSLEKVSGIPSLHESVQDVLGGVRELRKQFPMFQERRFVLTDRLGRLLGGALGKLTHDTIESLSGDTVLNRLEVLFRHDLTQPITRERLREVVNHPNATVALNALLPHKNIPTNIEKLYWLLYPDTRDLEVVEEDLRQGMEALWLLLVRVTGLHSHNTAE